MRYAEALQACDPSIRICVFCAEGIATSIYGATPPTPFRWERADRPDGRGTLAWVATTPEHRRRAARSCGIRPTPRDAVAVSVPPSDGVCTLNGLELCSGGATDVAKLSKSKALGGDEQIVII